MAHTATRIAAEKLKIEVFALSGMIGGKAYFNFQIKNSRMMGIFIYSLN
jgi:hypothetical protein